MALLDSPLNKAGRLRIVIQTKKGVLIKVSPNIRLPRTYKRFSGLMAQLLTKMRIRSPDTKEPLLEVVNGPISSHLPRDSFKVGTSTKGHLITELEQYMNTNQKTANTPELVSAGQPLVFVIGCTSTGSHGYDCEYTDDCISISHYALSTQCVCQRVVFAAEEMWGVQ
jgi:rRNA small subunit pseudouridine methyltransferase Nep1